MKFLNQQHLLDEKTKLLDAMRINNYQQTYPVPEFFVKHKKSNPKSFYIQVLGVRGAGKSTFVNRLMKLMNLNKAKAKTGSEETTLETEFFDITSAMTSLPIGYEKVFLVDQPGIGGLKVKEANYLENYGPGKLSGKRFNGLIQCAGNDHRW